MNRTERRAAERQSRRPPPRQRISPHEHLSAAQIRDLGLAHIVNLDAIANGTADVDILWQWVGGVLTWSKAAELVGAGVPEMHEQLALTTAVIERWRRTGRVGFSGIEYQAAKTGVAIMDELAAITPKVKAIEAAGWSENRLNELVGGV
jgi:hypothetical protein